MSNNFHPATDDIIEWLNEVLSLDRDFISKLVNTRISCNNKISEHPSIQVGGTEENPSSGLLGLLNGFCGTFKDGPKKGWGPICAVCLFDTILKFERTENK